MAERKRTPFVGGNWKSNGTKSSVSKLVADLNEAKLAEGTDIVVAPTFLHLSYVLTNISKRYNVAAQNVSATATGAFTGEVSASQLKDAGIDWTIIGHSERRALYHDNEVVAKKVAISIKEGLSVIACVGETLEDRKAEKTMAVIQAQLDVIIGAVTDWSRLVIAYEPVWAIGTGQTATPDQAQTVHAAIRKYLGEKVSSSVADQIRIIYGGSVTKDNCELLFAKPDIDGFLVGGASLVADSFAKIVASTLPKTT